MIPTTVEITYELVTAVGRTVDTFSHEDLARRRLAERKDQLPGATIQKVTIVKTREPVYRPRLAAVGA